MVLNIDCMLESLGKVLFVFNANRGFPGDTVVKDTTLTNSSYS